MRPTNSSSCVEGKMEFEIAGQVCHPVIREELLIPACALHSARNIGATTARWLYGYKRWGCDRSRCIASTLLRQVQREPGALVLGILIRTEVGRSHR